jgi:ABC-type Co2+ transport system permease subunit
MLRVPIRSRLGNGVLGLLGVVYFISATATLIYYIVTSWGATSLTDNVLQMGLIAAAIGGLFFIAIAKQNLMSPRAAAKSHSARDHQTSPATGS